MFVRQLFWEKDYSGNKLFICIYLNSCSLSIPYILDIYVKKHKVLWNLNGFNYIGIPFMDLSQKRLNCVHGIDQNAELKKKKRTRKDIANVRCLILVTIYGRRSTKKKVANIYNFITPCVKFF